LPRPIGEVFPFFGDARNLEVITPPWLRFKVLTPGEIVMRPGAIIDYRLKLRGLPLAWRSEITAWEPPHRFVDEQRKGPYSLWVHEHRFSERDGGTSAEDIVKYAVPGGGLLHRLFVKRDVEKIFDYRATKLKELFPEE
jgi:ligand-binding SRPBCC domain-containing protein